MIDYWDSINEDEFYLSRLSIPAICLTKNYISRLLIGEIDSPFKDLGSEANFSLWHKFIVGKWRQYCQLFFADKNYTGTFDDYLIEPKTVTKELLSGKKDTFSLHYLNEQINIDLLKSKNFIK